MAGEVVTDPDLIATLEAKANAAAAAPNPVTDPETIAALEKEAKRRAAPSTVYDPTQGMSTMDKFMAGAGKGVVDTGRGLQQLYAKGADYLDPQGRSAAVQQDIDNSRQLDAPLLNTKAGNYGNIAGQTAPALLGPEGWLPAAGFNAALGAVQPTSGDESRLGNATTSGIGSTLGSGLAAGLKRLAVPVRNQLTDTAKAAVDKLTAAGVPLDVAQRTGSELLQRVKSGLSAIPVTAGWVKDSTDAQKRAFTVAALKTMGSDGDKASTDVMADAKRNIGNVFDDAAARGAKYDPKLESDLQDVQSVLQRTVPKSNHGPINTQIDDILDSAAKNDGHIDGSVLQRIHSDLGGMMQNSDLAVSASGLKRALSDAQARSSTPEQVAELAKARSQYRNMKLIEGSVRDEDVSPKLLANALRTKQNRPWSIYGHGDQDLPDLAKAGASVLPQTLGDSGTAGRHGAIAMLGAPAAVAAPLIYTVGHGMISGEPIDSEHVENAGKHSAEILSGILAAKGAKAAFSSKAFSDYLANGIGGSADSGALARGARAALTAPDRAKTLANALRGLGATDARRPGSLQNADQ